MSGSMALSSGAGCEAAEVCHDSDCDLVAARSLDLRDVSASGARESPLHRQGSSGRSEDVIRTSRGRSEQLRGPIASRRMQTITAGRLLI
jgi:hypothetical protein